MENVLKKRKLISYRNRARRFQSDKNPIYLNRNRKTYGPYCEIDIASFLSHKNVSSTDKIWFPALDKWISVGDYVDDYYIPSDIEVDTPKVYYLLRNGESWGPYEAGKIVDFILKDNLVSKTQDHIFSFKWKKWMLVDHVDEIGIIIHNRGMVATLEPTAGFASQPLHRSWSWYLCNEKFIEFIPPSKYRKITANLNEEDGSLNTLKEISLELNKFFTESDWEDWKDDRFTVWKQVFDRQLLKELLPQTDPVKAKELHSEEDWKNELSEQMLDGSFPSEWKTHRISPSPESSLHKINSVLEKLLTQNEKLEFSTTPLLVLKKTFDRQLLKEIFIQAKPELINENKTEDDWQKWFGIFES